MASFYGTDAGRSALESQYVSILPKAAPVRAGGLSAMIDQLVTLDAWANARVILLPTPDLSSTGMGRLAVRALSEGKRVGVAVRWNAEEAEGPLGMVDFVETTSADDVMRPAARINAPSGGGWPEGSTAGFSCDELLGGICVVPGLVFDGQGHFVGSDNGAYSRFLRFFPGHKVALVDPLQVSSNPLPHEAGDIPVDYLVTPTATWPCR